MVDKPKAREIHAAHYRDRVVHHWLVPILEGLYEPVFIHDVYSNRQGKGTHAAVRRLRHFMRGVSRTGKGGGFFLQLDIRNFFNSVDRRILFSQLQQRLRKGVRQGKISEENAVLVRDISHIILKQDVGKESFMAATAAEIGRIPPYKRLINAGPDRGLPIGNLTSQFFANVYLNELDQFVKHQLKCRHYLRYVDDFILLHPDPDQLRRWACEIRNFLQERLGLELKTPEILQPVRQGANFLGYIVRPEYLLVRRRVVGNLWEKLIRFEKQWIKGSNRQGWNIAVLPEPREHLRGVLASYWGHFSHACHYRLVRRVFTRFPWLSCLFDLRRERLVPLWQPAEVSGYKSQQRFFRRWFPNAEIKMQRGCRFDTFPPRRAGSQATPGNPALEKNRSAVSRIIVRQQGYLKGGLRRRCLASLTIPPLSQTGVSLCGSLAS